MSDVRDLAKFIADSDLKPLSEDWTAEDIAETIMPWVWAYARNREHDIFLAAANLVELEVCHTSSCYLSEGPFTKPYDHRMCVTLRHIIASLRLRSAG